MPNMNRSFSSKLAWALALVTVAALPAMAAQTGFSNHNSKDPIQFSADRLEVQNEGSVAKFMGKVEAIQGDMTLWSDEVRVYYQDSKTKAAGATPAPKPSTSSGMTGSVTRIDSRGNVRITSRGDTAEGDWAVYDVGRQLVTMGGRVVLHQGESVVRGSRLELNLNSGQARVVGLPDLQGEQRVRGEFTPATNNKGTSDKKSDAAPKKDK
jgi:lipopolysaccharide export system protein LptA